MIEGVVVQKLTQIPDNRGMVMHMLRCDSPIFIKFGEIYFSVVNPGAVKAWKRHTKMTQHFAVPVGTIRLVLYDDREGSASNDKTAVIEVGEDNYSLVRIPPLVWYGFKGISTVPALIANCTDMPYDPDEVERIGIADEKIPYVFFLEDE